MIRAISSIFVVALVALTSSQTTQETPVSPCPSVFTYEPPGSEPGKWYGVVNLTTDTTLYALWLNIVLESKADILGNWVGEVTTEDNLDFKIENTKMTINPGPPLPVRFFIQYNPQNDLPKLKKIRFNGKEICNVNTLPVFETENNSNMNVFGKSTTTLSKSSDRRQTTSKSQYWLQTEVENNYQGNSENKQTTEKPQYWAPAKIEDKTTPRPQIWPTVRVVNIQQANTESKNQNRVNDSSKSITTKKEQPKASQQQQQEHSRSSSTASQSKSKTKIENGQQTIATDKPKTTTETRPQNIIENKSQSWSYTKVENNQQANTQNDRNVRPEEKYQITSKRTIRNSTQSYQVTTQPTRANFKGENQETESDNRLLQSGTNPSLYPKIAESTRSENRQQTTTKKPQALEYTEGRLGGKLRHEEVPEVKETLSDEWLSNWSGDKSVSWTEQGKNKEVYALAGDSSIDNDDGIVKSLNDRSIFQLTTEYPLPATTKPPAIEDFDDPPKKEEPVENYFGGLPAIYIPHHGHRTVDHQCGKVLLNGVPSNSLRGSTTLEGQWPWQVALYQQQTTVDFKYICGGTLVSRRHVITAAHCVTRKGSRRVVNKNTLTVYLGKHNLRTSVDGVQVKFVNRILVTTEYDATTFKGDLAILELRGAITYSEWVQPACLWPENEDIKTIVGKRGSIVGWGFDIRGQPREELRQLQMRVVDQETCINNKVLQYADFYRRFTSDLTYCAGYIDGYTDCNGDSGGGMVIERDDIWYLRGVVSLSVARQGEYLCDPDHYVVFTDIAKYLSWIEEYVDDY